MGPVGIFQQVAHSVPIAVKVRHIGGVAEPLVFPEIRQPIIVLVIGNLVSPVHCQSEALYTG